MATNNRILQLLRTSLISENKQAAKNYVEGTGTTAVTPQDGEIRLARYWHPGQGQTGAVVKSLICVYHDSPSLPKGTTAGWTYIEDATTSGDSAAALSGKIDNIISSVELASDGTYTPATGTYLPSATGTTVKDGLEALDGAIDTLVTTTLPATYKALQTAQTDSDSTGIAQVVTTISQDAQGVITPGKQNLSAVKVGAYTTEATPSTGAIAATDTLETALHKLENGISSVAVTSTDKTVNITNGRDLSVNIDGTTLVKDSSTGVISSDLKILKETTNLAANVKEQYKLIYGSSTTAIGDPIKIYKDSSIVAVKLSTADATWDSTNNVIADGTGEDALALAYNVEGANDTWTVQVVTIPVGSFLRESEFGNGLNVTNHVVSVKAGDGVSVSASGVSVNAGDGLVIGSQNNTLDVNPGNGIEIDSDAVNVKIDSTSEAFLTVGSGGVKLSGVQTAINTAAAGSATTLTTVAAGTETTADGTDFIKVVADTTAADGHTNYAVSTKGIKDAIAVETTRAESAETAIDSAIGLTKAQNGETRSYTSQVTLGTDETAPTTVAGDIDLLDAHVEALNTALGTLDGAAVKSVNGSDAININTTSPADAQNPVVELKLDTTTGGNALSITSGQGLYLSNTWDCGTY